MIEQMADFFTARAEGYDRHMLENVEGCRQGYLHMAQLVPPGAKDLLDLGCGTGLELDAIFTLRPGLSVTGIDLTQAMLDQLRQKHPDKSLTLINASYFDVEFGTGTFDAAVSFQTLHHFTHREKTGLYTKIHHALRPGGVYIECDYMVLRQEEEDFYFAENRRIRQEQGVSPEAFYHYDTPCTVENQLAMLRQAGFGQANRIWRQGNTTLILAEKSKEPQSHRKL